MGFKKVDCVEEMNKMMQEDPEVTKYVQEFNKQYELMQSIVKARKELGLTQKD